MRDFDQIIPYMTPRHLGAEVYKVSETLGAIAMAGTGFDPDNLQHRFASDAVHYAIAIQQLRDAGDYALVDAARAFVEMTGAKVMMGRDRTTVKTLPFGYEGLNVKARKAFKLESYSMPIHDGLIFDPDVQINLDGRFFEPPVRREV